MNRKDEHLFLAQQFHQEKINDFDAVRFVHHSFPEISCKEVDISTELLGYTFQQPFYINAMTGGSSQAKTINQQLGIIAKETGVLLAMGSLNAALKNPQLKDSYTIIRKENPAGVILANLGASASLEDAKKAVELVQANGLQIHLNAPQELVMPEGEYDFTNWLSTIEKLVNGLDVPVIVKEVGFGMSRETIQQLLSVGVQIIDVSGKGGTSFTQIENARRAKKELEFLEDWGHSAVLSLLEADSLQKDVTILASGGIRNSLDILKALSLGAKSVGTAGTILNLLIDEGLEQTIEKIKAWEQELTLLYTLVGKKRTQDLTSADITFERSIIDWCESREIDYKQFAKRSKRK